MLKEVFGRVLVVIMCNGGQNPIYEILPNEDSDNNTEKEPLGEDKGDEDDTMEVDGQTPKKRAAFRLVPFETVEYVLSRSFGPCSEISEFIASQIATQSQLRCLWGGPVLQHDARRPGCMRFPCLL